VLARLDPEDAKLAAQGCTGDARFRRERIRARKSELERHADLLNKKFISQSAYDVKQNAFNAAKAKVEQARSQARSPATRLRTRTSSRTPMAS
jgi:multidrug resistance efflux pump